MSKTPLINMPFAADRGPSLKRLPRKAYRMKKSETNGKDQPERGDGHGN